MDSENTQEPPCESFWDSNSSSDENDDETNEEELRLRGRRSGPPSPAPDPPTQQTPVYSEPHALMAQLRIRVWLCDFQPCPEKEDDEDEEKFYRICKNLGLPYRGGHALSIEKLEKQLANPKFLFKVLEKVQGFVNKGRKPQDIGDKYFEAELARDILTFDWKNRDLKWMIWSVR